MRLEPDELPPSSMRDVICLPMRSILEISRSSDVPVVICIAYAMRTRGQKFRGSPFLCDLQNRESSLDASYLTGA